jgi:hypothetical protein
MLLLYAVVQDAQLVTLVRIWFLALDTLTLGGELLSAVEFSGTPNNKTNISSFIFEDKKSIIFIL